MVIFNEQNLKDHYSRCPWPGETPQGWNQERRFSYKRTQRDFTTRDFPKTYERTLPDQMEITPEYLRPLGMKEEKQESWYAHVSGDTLMLDVKKSLKHAHLEKQYPLLTRLSVFADMVVTFSFVTGYARNNLMEGGSVSVQGLRDFRLRCQLPLLLPSLLWGGRTLWWGAVVERETHLKEDRKETRDKVEPSRGHPKDLLPGPFPMMPLNYKSMDRPTIGQLKLSWTIYLLEVHCCPTAFTTWEIFEDTSYSRDSSSLPPRVHSHPTVKHAFGLSPQPCPMNSPSWANSAYRFDFPQ